jgi:hypothetical protein
MIPSIQKLVTAEHVAVSTNQLPITVFMWPKNAHCLRTLKETDEISAVCRARCYSEPVIVHEHNSALFHTIAQPLLTTVVDAGFSVQVTIKRMLIE